MNYKMMGRLIAQILLAEAAFMVPALIISLVGQDSQAILGFALSILVILAVAGMLMFFARKAKKGFYAREGMVCVGLAWIVMSLLGCLPFWISREIPSYLDGLFEIVSGFTTTGASILSNVEGLSKGMLYWRSFSHWVGGMGVLVFLLAVVPSAAEMMVLQCICFEQRARDLMLQSLFQESEVQPEFYIFCTLY